MQSPRFERAYRARSAHDRRAHHRGQPHAAVQPAAAFGFVAGAVCCET
jgi:hypothetical protein